MALQWQLRAMVFNRRCAPDPKLGCLRWLDTVTMPAIPEGVTHQHRLRAMDALMDHAERVDRELAKQIRPSTAEAAAEAVRSHRAIGNRLHWVLDVTFRDDRSRLRKGHGARNMATVRHFALNPVRSAKDRRSLKSRRKRAGRDPAHLQAILSSQLA